MRLDDQPSHLTYLSELSFKCSPEKMTLLGIPDRSRAEGERRQSLTVCHGATAVPRKW